MATIKPFKGIRPPKELVEKVESRPYDVLSSEEARAEAERLQAAVGKTPSKVLVKSLIPSSFSSF